VHKAEEIVRRVLGRIREDRKVLPDKIYEQCMEMIYVFSSVLKQHNGTIQEVRDESNCEMYREVRNCGSLYELEGWFDMFIKRYFIYLDKLKKQKYGSDISKALDYISSHYAEDIKLSNIAAHISMNETYLSHLFKKSTSSNFTDYLNAVRIEKAKELLKSSELSIYRIAEQVGYANESYFSKVFKQIAGHSPKDYRKQKFCRNN
jgi:two-component system response regulator YesN